MYEPDATSPRHDVHQQHVDVVAAEMRVAVGRQHLEHAVLDAQDRDVERAAAEVVDGDDAGVPLVEAVGERRRGRLVDDAQHLEAGDAARVARRRALRVVEVRGHGDDRAVDLVVELALSAKNASARCFSSRRMNAEISGGVNSRSPRPIRTTPPDRRRPGTESARPRRTSLAALAHEPLHRIGGARRVGQQPPLRLAPDVTVPSLATETTDGTSPSPRAIADDRRAPSLT